MHKKLFLLLKSIKSRFVVYTIQIKTYLCSSNGRIGRKGIKEKVKCHKNHPLQRRQQRIAPYFFYKFFFSFISNKTVALRQRSGTANQFSTRLWQIKSKTALMLWWNKGNVDELHYFLITIFCERCVKHIHTYIQTFLCVNELLEICS